MEEVFGYIESVLFANEENGFIIAKIKEPKKQEVTTIVGTMPGIHIGENIPYLETLAAHLAPDELSILFKEGTTACLSSAGENWTLEWIEE